MSTQPPLPSPESDKDAIIQRLPIQSNKDILTGAYNAQYFRELLRLEVARAERYKVPLSLLIGEIDNFRELNATLGGLGGDKALKGVTHLLQISSRLTDVVCRTGANELAIILTHTERLHADITRKRLQHCLERRLPEDLRNISISMTFGVEEYQPGESPDSFIIRVEQALQRAKKGDDSDEGFLGVPVRA